jgi:ribonuclease P protein component
MDHDTGRVGYEKNVSTEQPQAQKNARFSSPHGDEERAAGVEPSTCQRSGTVGALAPGRRLIGGDAPQGFPRARRLTRPAQFNRVFSRSQRSSDQYFTVLANDNNGQDPRLGLAISKRAAKKAVERNRLKRLVRDVFRRQNDLPAQDFVVMAGAAAKSASNSQLRASLERHFRRLADRHRANRNG